MGKRKRISDDSVKTLIKRRQIGNLAILRDLRDARAEAAKYKTALEEIKDSHADRGDITWLTANEALIE
jgi:hypothetical protein